MGTPFRAFLLTLGILAIAYGTHASGRWSLLLAPAGGVLIGVWSVLNDRRAV